VNRQFALMPLGGPELSDDAVVAAVISLVREAFAASVVAVPAVPLSEDAYNPSREQYHSTVLLNTLTRHKRAEWSRLLGITDVDLYTPDLNFVFGQADARRGVAVFSVARLHTPDRKRFVRRAATEAIHELGHTYGLQHCHDPRCVMWFSNTLAESDRKGTRFCQTHASELRLALS
jgi:archaemetzincin